MSLRPKDLPKRQKKNPITIKENYSINSGSGINRKPYATDESELFEDK